jgi:hypothetical protein
MATIRSSVADRLAEGCIRELSSRPPDTLFWGADEATLGRAFGKALAKALGRNAQMERAR